MCLCALIKCQIYKTQKSWFTCLLDGGWGLCHGGLFTGSTLVLSEDPEDVGVTHDQVWNSGVQSVIMIQYCEPVLWRDSSTGPYTPDMTTHVNQIILLSSATKTNGMNFSKQFYEHVPPPSQPLIPQTQSRPQLTPLVESVLL